jgi:hypothetical protein
MHSSINHPSSPLELDHEEEALTDSNSQGPRLDVKIIGIVKSLSDRSIRPARLATELGISVNDACAELCGLLAAVGGGQDGASFRFEKVGGQDVMVFEFPPDFEKRALRKRRYDDFWSSCRHVLCVGFRAMKIITAFGLILSLLILCVAAAAGLIAALVALSRDGSRGGGHRTILMRQFHSLFYTIRQLLWFYAAFGPDTEGQHPFLREIAYDLSLVLSCCCGNPGSIFYWMRASQLSRRRNRIARGWRSDAIESDIEGVSLIRRGGWGEADSNRTVAGEDGYRGLLSVAVEFLFGPTQSSPADLSSSVWRLRAAVIVSHCSTTNGGVALEALAPYVDYPPESFDTGSSVIVEQGLLIVSHFNGIPSQASPVQDMVMATFIFPELMAESELSVQYVHSPVSDDGTWADILYAKDEGIVSNSKKTELPDHYREERCRFTNLTRGQLSLCVTLGILNLIGVVWLGQSVGKGGVLELEKKSALATILVGILLPLLRSYGLLFLALPAARLISIILVNVGRKRRNDRRQTLALRCRR